VHFATLIIWEIRLQSSDIILPLLSLKILFPFLPFPLLIFSYLQALIHGFLWWWACSWLIFSLKWRLQSLFLLLHSTAIDLQEAKDSIDKEDPMPTSSTWSYVNHQPRKWLDERCWTLIDVSPNSKTLADAHYLLRGQLPRWIFLFVNVYKKIAHIKNYIVPPVDFFNPKSKQKKYIQHKNNMLKPKPFSPILIIFTVSQKNFINCIEHTVSHTKLVTYHTHLITMWIIPHSLWPSQFSKQPNTIVSHLHFFIHFP